MEIAWNLHKFGTSPWYGTTINLFLSKLCRKNPTRNVVDSYEMGIMVYFEFWVEMVFGLEGNSGENGQNWSFLLCLTPLRLCVGVHA